MYASFLLKYSKSYLHTCIIFYMFIPFFSFNATRADVSRPSRVLNTPLLPTQNVTKTFRHFLHLSLYRSICSFSLSINDFYFPLVLLSTDHRRWTQWGTPARSGSKKKGASQISGTDTSGFKCICMYAYVCVWGVCVWGYIYVCVCIIFYGRVIRICV